MPPAALLAGATNAICSNAGWDARRVTTTTGVRLRLMGTAKPKSFASQPKRPSQPTQPSVRAQGKPPRLTFGLPGNASERAERRHALMDEHRETLRRLGE